MNLQTRVETRGPFFSPYAPQALKSAMNGATKELVQIGESIIINTMTTGPRGVFLSVAEARPKRASGGNYRRNINTSTNNLNGLIEDGNVVYGPWLEGESSRNQTTRFKGYFTFRKTSQELQKKSRKVFDAHLRRFVNRMNK